jgi:hypothetical protein
VSVRRETTESNGEKNGRKGGTERTEVLRLSLIAEEALLLRFVAVSSASKASADIL